MKYYWTLFGLGILIFFTPLLGIPLAWKWAFLFISGALVIGISLSFIIRARSGFRSEAPPPSTHEGQ